MTRLAAGLAAVLLLLLLLGSCREATSADAPENRKPTLFLLTSLPIVWSESFGLDQPGSVALKALEGEYQVRPADLPSQLPERALLLAAQPRALPAEELVALDGWVRRGGRLVLLADPVVEWPSERPLGDPRRAPTAFPDTGLLRHWGLRLDAPEKRGPIQSRIGRHSIRTASPGTLVRTAGTCAIEREGLVARCRIGKGRANIVADADFINPGPGLDRSAEDNLPALLSELAAVSH